MRKLLIILLSIISLTLMAQVPQGVGYQAVATDANGIELVNQSISIRASVLSGSATGTIEWEETHATSTDAFGLFTLTIGQGTNTTNGLQTSFADISWGTNTYFLKIEMDVTGGNNYSFMGTNQMMSVPYALYAENANIDYDSISTMISNDSAFIISITGGLSGNSFGERIPINLQWYGPITNSFTSYNSFFTTEIQAQEDGFLTGTVNTSDALDFFCDTFSGNATYFGQFSDTYGNTKSTFNFPIKEGDYYYFRYSNSFYSGQVLDLFFTPLNTINFSSTSINYDSLANIISMDSTFLSYVGGGSGCNFKHPEGYNGEGISIQSNNANPYTVPTGKRLYITNTYASGSSTLDITGVGPIAYKLNTQSSGNLAMPIIINSGEQIESSNTGYVIVNGYLVDENYFAGCGGGGSSSSTSSLDSTTIANMIANASGGGSFGDFISINSTIETQASTDGFLCGEYSFSSGGNSASVTIFCDTFSGNTTNVAGFTANIPFGSTAPFFAPRKGAYNIPIKKGDYFSFTISPYGSITSSYFVPLEGGGSSSTSTGLDSATVVSMIASAVSNSVGSSMPTGVIQAYSGEIAPTGWLLCDGSAVSRTTYADLFALIDTTYGSGYGSTTFNLPDLRGRAPVGKDNMGGNAAGIILNNGDTLGNNGGEETHTLTVAEMPSHSHSITANNGNNWGGVSKISYRSPTSSITNWTGSTNPSGGDQAHNNMPPFLIINYIIRY